MSLVAHLISQPRPDISLIWTPIIEKEVKKKNYNSIKFRLDGNVPCLYWYYTDLICVILISTGLFAVRCSLLFRKFHLLET
jgi:hypothetical protein